MKNGYKAVGIIILVVAALAIISPGRWPPVGYSASLTPGYSFSTNEQVTHIKLNDLVSNASISSIVSSEITDLTISTADIANSAITTAKILDSTILTADIANRTILAANMATGTVTEVELSTNIVFRPGFLTFSNGVDFVFSANQITNVAVRGVTNSAGAADANMIVKLGPDGKINNSMLNVPSVVSNSALATFTTDGTAYVWSQVCAVTSTVTSGSIVVYGNASVATANSIWVRVRDSGTNIVSIGVCKAASVNNGQASATLVDALSGSTKIYCLDVASDGTSTALTNALDIADSPLISNGLGLRMIQQP